MVWCKGCEVFRDRVLDPTQIPNHSQGFDEEEQIIILHNNYEDLSVCAETSCDLCKYLRREIWYSHDDCHYFERLDVDSPDRMIMVKLWREPDPYSDHTYTGKSTGYLKWRLGIGYLTRIERNVWTKPLLDSTSREADPIMTQIIEMGHGWLKKCQSEHRRCEPYPDGCTRFLPAMLLDSGTTGQESIRLTKTTTNMQASTTKYVSLSYCWGSTANLTCTTKSNLAGQLEAIPVEHLPHTIRDAVQVTRAFGVQYLWVDALCIVQGTSPEDPDLQIELSNMGRIYRHSLFTIAASSAENSGAGLFSRSTSSNWAAQDYHLARNEDSTTGGRTFILKATPPAWNIEVESSNLSARGWVLQERMSASRTLFFTEEGIFWECNELRASECEVQDRNIGTDEYPTLQDISADIMSFPDPDLCSGTTTKFPDIVLVEKRYMKNWTNLIERYSEKVLTMPTDRLPAIKGIMTDISNLSGVEFTMGTLGAHLLQGIDWSAKNPLQNRPNVRQPDIPSWSWASVDRPIDFDQTFCNEELFHRTAHNLSLEGMQIRLRTYLQCLRVATTSLTECIRTPGGVGIEYQWEVHEKQMGFFNGGPNARIYQCEPVNLNFDGSADQSTSETYEGRIIFDTLHDDLGENEDTITCILWRENRRGKGQTSAMVVSPIEGMKGIYRRRGWIAIDTSDLFQGEAEDVVLV